MMAASHSLPTACSHRIFIIGSTVRSCSIQTGRECVLKLLWFASHFAIFYASSRGVSLVIEHVGAEPISYERLIFELSPSPACPVLVPALA